MLPARPDRATLLLCRKTDEDRINRDHDAAMEMASSYAALIELAEQLAYRSTDNARAAEFATKLFIAARQGQASVQTLVQQRGGLDGEADEPIIVMARN